MAHRGSTAHHQNNGKNSETSNTSGISIMASVAAAYRASWRGGMAHRSSSGGGHHIAA